MSSFDEYDFHEAKEYAKQMSSPCLAHDNLSLWNTDDLEAATLKEIFESMIMGVDSKLGDRLTDCALHILNIDEVSIWNSERMMIAQLLQLKQSTVFKKLIFIKKYLIL